MRLITLNGITIVARHVTAVDPVKIEPYGWSGHCAKLTVWLTSGERVTVFELHDFADLRRVRAEFISALREWSCDIS